MSDSNDTSKRYQAELMKLLEKAETEQNKLESEDSFHFAKSRRRDIVVHCVVTILPRVNGKHVIGEKQIELEQLCFEVPARALPAKQSLWRKAYAELMTLSFQQIMKIGGVRL